MTGAPQILLAHHLKTLKLECGTPHELHVRYSHLKTVKEHPVHLLH